jgi:predicted Holliday junction resolvase-like endonuclease
MGYEILALVLGIAVGAFCVYFALRPRSSSQIFSHARSIASQMFESQKSQLEQSIRQTYDARFEEWKATTLTETIEKNRADAVDTSRAVLKEKIAEQIAPLLPGFLASYHPADARFIGSPIDYLIFRNMNKGNDCDDPIEIVLLDVKTGQSGLTPLQKKIQTAANEKRIAFHVLRIDEPPRVSVQNSEAGSATSMPSAE